MGGMEEHECVSEVRHAITHKVMLDDWVVIQCVDYIVVFLYEKYWVKHYNMIKKMNHTEGLNFWKTPDLVDFKKKLKICVVD